VAELTLSAVLHREDDWFVAECPELGTASQGRAVEEALANLREASELYLEEQPERRPPSARALLTTFSVTAPDAAAA
jgi:predicted RNase H-like HicB family nuclease